MQKKIVDITQMKNGESGIIRKLSGGMGFSRRIRAMGIRPGKAVKKISSHFWRGPQTIEVDKMKVAVGYGMAQKIYVETE